MSGMLYVVSAPSGAGKTSLVATLVATDPLVFKSVSYTTRSPRRGEQDGREYHFVSRDEFTRMLRQNELLEHATVYDNYYGTSRRWVEDQTALGHDIVLEIDWQGAAQVRALIPETVSIFIVPPSLQTLEARLRTRGQDGEDTIAKRMGKARDEIAHLVDFDYVIINDDFNRAAQDLIGAVRAERLKVRRQLARHRDFFHQIRQ